MLASVLLLLSALGQMGAAAQPDTPSNPTTSSPSLPLTSFTTSSQSRWLNSSSTTPISATSRSASTTTTSNSFTRTSRSSSLSHPLPPTQPTTGTVTTTTSTDSRSASTSVSCITSNPAIVYSYTTITIPGSTVYVSGNATDITSTSAPAETTGPEWCPTALLSASEFKTSPPPGATTLAPVPFQSSTFVMTSTVKTSVYVNPETVPPVQFTDPGLLPPGSSPTSPPQSVSPPNQQNPAPSLGSQGGKPGGGGLGGSAPSSALAPEQSSTPGSGSGSSGTSSGGNAGDVPSLGAIIGSIFGSPGSSGGSNGGSDGGASSSGSSSGGSSGSPGSVSGPSLGNPGVVVNNIPVNQGPSNNVVIGSSIFQEASTAQTVSVNGETLTILPSNAGVVVPGGMTVPAPAAGITPGPSLTFGSETFSLNPSNPTQLIVDGSTIQLPSSGSTVLSISGTAYTVEPSAIIAGSSTLSLPAGLAPAATFTAETIDGITFDIGSTLAVISGTTVTIGPGAPTSTLVFGSETIIAGPNGLVFPHTTAAPLSSIEVMDGITFGLEASDVVISGTTYDFDHPTTLVLGSETVIIGPGGVILPKTTLDLQTSTSLPTLTKAAPKETAATSPKASPTNGAVGGPHVPGLIEMCGTMLAAFVAGLGIL